MIIGGAATAVTAGVAVVVLTVAAPSSTRIASAALPTSAGELDVTTVERAADHATFRLTGAAVGEALDVTARPTATQEHGGRDAVRYLADSVDTPVGGTEKLPLSEVAQLNGGRLPLGVGPESDPGDISVSRYISREVAVWVDARTGDVLDAEVAESVRTVADLSVGRLPLGHPEESVVATTDGTVTARGTRSRGPLRATRTGRRPPCLAASRCIRRHRRRGGRRHGGVVGRSPAPGRRFPDCRTRASDEPRPRASRRLIPY